MGGRAPTDGEQPPTTVDVVEYEGRNNGEDGVQPLSPHFVVVVVVIVVVSWSETTLSAQCNICSCSGSVSVASLSSLKVLRWSDENESSNESLVSVGDVDWFFLSFDVKPWKVHNVLV